jgi:PAS domain S-box-containing protein
MANVERRVADRWLELREREQYIRHLVDNTGEAIFLCDEQGKVLDINRRACESLGYRREQLLLMSLADVETPAAAEDPGPSPGCPVEGYPQVFEAVHRRQDGTTFPVEVHVTKVGHDAQRALLVIVRDITGHNLSEKTRTTDQVPSADSVGADGGLTQPLAVLLDNLQTAQALSAGDPEAARRSLDEGVRLLRKIIDAGP